VKTHEFFVGVWIAKSREINVELCAKSREPVFLAWSWTHSDGQNIEFMYKLTSNQTVKAGLHVTGLEGEHMTVFFEPRDSVRSMRGGFIFRGRVPSLKVHHGQCHSIVGLCGHDDAVQLL
jgi:hypothetical protein